MKNVEIEKIKESDVYFLKNVEDSIKILDEIDVIIETNGERQSTSDSLISDLLHILEDLSEETSDCIFAKLGREISKARKKEDT